MSAKIYIDCSSCEEFFHNKEDKGLCFKNNKETEPFNFCKCFKEDAYIASIRNEEK